MGRMPIAAGLCRERANRGTAACRTLPKRLTRIRHKGKVC